MNALPEFIKTALRTFIPGELHITRTCDFDVLIIMLDGELIFHEDGKRVSLRPGQWYIQRAGLFQQGKEPSNSPRYYYIHFHGVFSTEETLQTLPLAGAVETEPLLPLLRELFNVERSFHCNRVACNALFFSVLSRLHGSRFAASRSQRLLRKMENYLTHHYMHPHTLKKMAREFQLSHTYITRIFRQQLAITPHQYLTKLRIDQACQMMQDTNHPINDIAFEVGYQDVSSFFRAFTRQKNCAPSKWREWAHY
jgi:AraC family transcriptional regulator of adaptative response / methylphosphotriester-DNA alkyltransferase methyltransferase